jgi:hypothetical protein
MKTRTVAMLAAALSVLVSSCEKMGLWVNPSAEITTETKNITNFSGVDISNAFNAYVTFSDGAEQVEIEANENLHQYIEVRKTGNTLTVGLRNGVSIRNGHARMNVYITANHLTDFTASGASNIYVEDPLVTNSEVYVDLSGASSFLAGVDVDEMTLDMSGASNADLSGDVDHLRLFASGSSTLKDYDLWVNWFEGDLSGASNAYLTVNDRLDIEASGASNINFKGNGTIHSQNLSGASNVRRVN